MGGHAKAGDGARLSRRELLRSLAVGVLYGGDFGEHTAVASGPKGNDATAGWSEARRDLWLYSRYNLDSLQRGGAGVPFPRTVAQESVFEDRREAILDGTDLERPPVENDRWIVAPYRRGWPRYVRRPVFVPRPDGDTLQWKRRGREVVTPRAFAWANLAAVLWSVALESRFDIEEEAPTAQYFAQVYGSIAQYALRWGLFPNESHLRSERVADREDWPIALADRYSRRVETVATAEVDPTSYAAVLWFLSETFDFASEERFGFLDPRPLVTSRAVRELAEAVATVLFEEVTPIGILAEGTVRDVGLVLTAVARFGAIVDTGSIARRSREYAESLADLLAFVVSDDGQVVDVTADGSAVSSRGHQAATQGIVGQALLAASRLDGLNYRPLTELVLTYLLESLWDPAAGTFVPDRTARIYRISARDAGDVVGGLNAADRLGLPGVRDRFSTFVAETFGRGRLQRAQLLESADSEVDAEPPFPTGAGGRYGQAPVFNAAVAYDSWTDEWAVVDDRFDATGAMYLAVQCARGAVSEASRSSE